MWENREHLKKSSKSSSDVWICVFLFQVLHGGQVEKVDMILEGFLKIFFFGACINRLQAHFQMDYLAVKS